jgi:hypothetical protein
MNLADQPTQPRKGANPMTATKRLTWSDDGCLIRSGCGRFTIRLTFRGNATYRLLSDAATGLEYVCRTTGSAKDLARRLASEGGSR